MAETPMSEVPGHTYTAPDHCAWTDPMCPEPMEKGSMYCRPHQIAARKNILEKVLERYFTLLHGGTPAEDDLRHSVNAAMSLVELVAGHPLPEELVTAARLGVREMEARAHPQVVITSTRPGLPDELYQELRQGLAAVEVPGHTTTLQDELAGAQEKIKELEAQIGDRDAAERIHRFVAKSLDRLKPQLARRIAEVICPPLDVSADEVRGWSQLQIDEWAAIQRSAREAAERLVEKGLRFVPSDDEVEAVGFIVAGPSTPERLHEDGSRKIEVDWDEVVFQRLGPDAAAELRKCRAAGYEDWQLHALVPVPDEVVFGAELGPRGVGCFPPAEDDEDGRPMTVPPYAEQVLWTKRDVIGWVWPVDAHPDSDWRCVTNFPEVSGSGQFGREGDRQPRDRAIGWVLQQAHNLGEEADRG